MSNGRAIKLEDIGLTRIKPQQVARGQVWGDLTDRYVAMAGWTEKVADKGEDAEPTFRFHDTGRGLVAVFDGTGGAGAGIARRLADGSELTGAYVASRLTSSVVETWFTALVERQHDIAPEEVERLTTSLRAILVDEVANQVVDENGLKGSMKRQLPTTMAAAGFAERDGEVVVDALWAGDSRAYVLSPLGGLQVLSVDDTRETDALALIRNDMPMENLISADRPFRVNHRSYRLAEPTLVMTATDGCFGYVHTPAHFEYLVLETLQASADPGAWAAALTEELDAVAGDDVSFSVVGLGFRSFGHLQDSFAPRCDHLRSEHWDRFAGATNDREHFEALREASWAAYAEHYHALISGQGLER